MQVGQFAFSAFTATHDIEIESKN